MAIEIGEVTVVADKSFDVYTVSMSKQSGSWVMYIEYAVIVGSTRQDKKIVKSGNDFNTFYAAWLSGKQVIDVVIEAENGGIVVDEPTAEAEFYNEEVEPTNEE